MNSPANVPSDAPLNPGSAIGAPPVGSGEGEACCAARDVPRFVVKLGERLPAEESLARIPLAVTGRWVRGSEQFSISPEDLRAIARNFRDRLNGEINVDYDHASEMPEVAAGGPIPSAGRIVKLDSPEPHSGLGIRGSGLAPAGPSRFILWGWYEPTPRARQLIQDREYRYISPAIDWTARNKRSGKPQGATLTSVALTNRPFLEELPQIQLSDPSYQPLDEIAGPPASSGAAAPAPHPRDQKNLGGPMKQARLTVVDGKITVAHEDLKSLYTLDPEEMRRCLGEMSLLAPASLAASDAISFAQASSLLSEADARGKSISAVEVFHANVERTLEEAVRTGKILPRQREDWRRIALSDFPTFRKLLAEQKAQVPLRPTGFSAAPPEDVQAQVRVLVEQRSRELQIPFGQALTEIGREHPELVQEYRRAVSGS